MKRNTNILFDELSVQQVNNLTSIVNESLAIGFNGINTRVFSSAELWNIQRMKKAVGWRRPAL